MQPSLQTDHAIAQTVREEWGRLLAVLIKTTGDIQLAEDVLQDAVTIALTHWRENGLPQSPAAWLIQTARRRALDRFRRDKTYDKLQPELKQWLNLQMSESTATHESIPDKRLELIFTCCHPALNQKTQVALTLRTLGGLTTDEIATAFLDTPKAMAQRLVRAKNKIKLANIPYETPSEQQLRTRLPPVLAVIYFIFNEGYSASSGKLVTRNDLCDEAIRLARITDHLLPEETEVAGLLALMLLHDSRRFSRQNSNGEIIQLEFQNRSSWNKQKIVEGTELLKRTLKKQRAGPYQIQASISAIHAEATHWRDTDWAQIVALYELLHSMQPSPVIRVNQAVALSYNNEKQAALSLLEQIEATKELQNYQPYYTARADILQRSGDTGNAAYYLKKAISLTTNNAELEFLSRKLSKLTDGD